MRARWSVRWGWIFGVATILGLFSSFQAHQLSALETGKNMLWPGLVALNLAYWYVPALLTPSIMSLAQRFRLERRAWRRALCVHIIGVSAFSVIHVLCMVIVRMALFPNLGKKPSMAWWVYLQRQYLTNLDWAMMTYWAIVGLSMAMNYRQESEARAVNGAQLETKLAEAQLKALQAQLQPHFLFNTLHAISALVHKDVEAADRMISRLSDLLRLTLEHTGHQEITLKEELEFLQTYLEIEQTRFRDRLTVHLQIDPDVLDARVPTLILQPAVENAIRHGIARLTGEGLLEVSAHGDGNVLWMEVRDNGAGLSESALSSLQKGIGLSNTRARLECLYGSSHRFEFSNALGGLTVRIVIPLRTDTGAPAVASTVRVA